MEVSHPKGSLPQRAKGWAELSKAAKKRKAGTSFWLWFFLLSLIRGYELMLILSYTETCVAFEGEREKWGWQRNEDFINPQHHGPLDSGRDPLPVCQCLTWYKIYIYIYMNSWDLRPFIAYRSLCTDFNGNGFSVRTRERFSQIHLLDWNVVYHRKCQMQ